MKIFQILRNKLLTFVKNSWGSLRSKIKPRHAIGYHFFNDADTRYGIYDGVRSTYDGPLTLATDNMVLNITKDKITVRDIVSPEQAWSVPGSKRPPKPPAKGTVKDPLSDMMKAGRWNVDDALKPMVSKFKKEHHMK